MPLFKVQDDDRPGYIFAKNMLESISKWENAIRKENNMKKHELVKPPEGVIFIAEDHEIIIEEYWVGEE